jgi:shikimate kinase
MAERVSMVRAVFLVGFMGAGKTSVGRALGQRLNWIFEDLDDRIVRREGRAVSDIFRKSGEAAFRRIETEALQEMLEESRNGVARVVALGGGAFAQKVNLAFIKAAGVPTVFLDAAVEELWERCRKQAAELSVSRPLAQDRDQFRRLYRSRRRHYLKASVNVETSGRSVEEIAAEIEQALGLKGIVIRIEQGDVE